MVRFPWRGIVAVAATLAAVSPAQAGSLAAAGYEFSDEKGGFTLLDVSGQGTRADPFVVIEEIHGDGPAVLVIRRTDAALDRRHGVQMAIRLRKVVINRTGVPWDMFRLELREREDRPSDYGDGLSFDQTARMPRPFESDVFSRVDEDLEPMDSVTFSGGLVDVGGLATMDVSITDLTPIPEFLLRQSMSRPASRAPALPPELAQAHP